jgi:hypothetical protein
MYTDLAGFSPPSGTFVGCESFPGFGSALDNVVLGASGRFNITTTDYMFSHSCDAGADLEWGHSGTFSKRAANDTNVYAFHRDELWLRAQTFSGLAFGRVLCPKLSLSLGAVVNLPVESVARLCSSLTFNNCEVRTRRRATHSSLASPVHSPGRHSLTRSSTPREACAEAQRRPAAMFLTRSRTAPS